MITSEVLHITTNKIFVCTGFELTPGTDEYNKFQSSTESKILKDNRITFDREYVEPNQEEPDITE